MMQEINETIAIAESFGIQLPQRVYQFLFIVTILVIVLIYFSKFCSIIWNGIQFVKSHIQDDETKDFVEVRSSFVGHLEHEVEKLNRESEWDDSLHYTELEAEVEVRQYTEFDSFKSKNLIVWLNNLIYLIKNFRGIRSLEKIERNLTEAIIRSKSQAFIIIGDPGSGKTVSLRHLFLEMSKKAKNSKREDVTVPIYLNLKQLNIESDKISADEIRYWIIDQLVTGKDRTVREFVDKNFEKMLKKGQLFFLFDSFDEIPSVMDAQDENGIISKYSEAIDSFLHAGNKRRGLISSRPYRSPRKLDAQRMTILPLSNERIKKALKKYLRQESSLSKQIWNNLLQREDLLHVVRNPFYLALLTQYCKRNKRLPDRHFDLFEQFVQNRAKTDEDRLSHLGFTPDELIQHAEILAFAMTKTSNIGLEASVNQIRDITSDFDKTAGWDSSKIEALLSALTYSKLGRKSDEEVDRPISFSFVHRRFHEYFCARYLKTEYQSAPFEQFNSDNRWREILVLLCEVLPSELLNKVFESSLKSLKEGNSVNVGLKEHKKALETILFLKDAFKSRIEEIPKDIRLECSNLIKRQFQDSNLLNQKKALEALIIADTDSAHSIIESAFEQNSRYLNETTFRSCRILERIPKKISVAIRKNLFVKYVKMAVIKQYDYYSVLFSSSSALKPLNIFLKTLLISTLLQILFIIGTLSYLIEDDPKNILNFLYSTIFFLTIYISISLTKYKDEYELTNLDGIQLYLVSLFLNPLSCYSIVMLLTSIYLFNQTQSYLFSFVLIVLTLLYIMIYFESISSIFLIIKSILRDFKPKILLKHLCNFKLKYLLKYLLYITPVTTLIGILYYLTPKEYQIVIMSMFSSLFMFGGSLYINVNRILIYWRKNHKMDLTTLKELCAVSISCVGTVSLLLTLGAVPKEYSTVIPNYLERVLKLNNPFLLLLL